jgi:glycosyltransferase involved in cell wall biosynthesis
MSLVQLLNQMIEKVQPVVLTPRGSASEFFRKSGFFAVHEVMALCQFDHTRYGRYRGFRWLLVLRELVMLPYTYFAVKAFAAKHRDIELIHLNEITGIIVAVLLKIFSRKPLIVHIRAHLGEQTRGIRSRFLWKILFNHYVDQIICIDETVRSSIPQDTEIPITTIHNALDLRSAQIAIPMPLPDLMINPSNLMRVAIIGSLLPVKGVYDFFEAALCLLKKRQDLLFIYVGKGIRKLSSPVASVLQLLKLADNTEDNLKGLIDKTGLSSRILMLGHRDDLVNIYKHVDVLCFPSHYNAPGRPIFEAAYFSKPSIVAIENPMPDTLIDGITGLSIKARDPVSLANAIQWMADNPARRNEMGIKAQALALMNFDLKKNVDSLVHIYRRLGLRL